MLENCILYVLPMYEFLHSLGHFRPGGAKQQAQPLSARAEDLRPAFLSLGWSILTRLLKDLEAPKDVSRRTRSAPPSPCRREEAGAMQYHRRRSCPDPIEMRSPHGCGGFR